MMLDMCHTRPTAPIIPQAALEHMESIIYDPHKLLRNEDEAEVSEEEAFEDAPDEITKGNAPTEVKAADAADLKKG